MQDQPSRDLDRASYDKSVLERALLAILVEDHPAHYSVEEARRKLGSPDHVIASLVRAGLIHRHGDFVFATRAAVHFNDLEG